MTETPRRWKDVCLVFLLFATWMLPGLVGRDPWKPDEGYSFGLVLNILQTGDHVVPMLAGEPFMEKPPMLYNVAACFGQCLSPWLPLHDGVRGAMVFFHLLTFLFLGLASRELNGPGLGWLAPLIFIACLGPIHDAHMLVTDFTMLTGFALGYYGLALSRRRAWLGGLALGTGLGIAFMAKGLLGPGLIGLTALMLPVLFPNWRTRDYLATLLAMGLAALPWLLIWPALLHARDPNLFRLWFWDNNIGRFLGLNRLGPTGHFLFYFKIVPWFALPALPLALWAWWRNRRGFWQKWQHQLCCAGALVIFIVLSAARTDRSIYSMPMLIPLSLAGVAGLEALKGRAAVWINRASMTVFCLVILGFWLAWIGCLAQAPGWFWGLVHARVPRFEPRFEWAAFLIALIFTGLFLWRIATADGQYGRNVLVNWAAALACGYLLVMTIGLRLCEANNSYRPLANELKAKLQQERVDCVTSQGLGEVARAMLHYVAGLKTRRLDINEWDLRRRATPAHTLEECNYCLVQSNYQKNRRMGPPPQGPWDLLWEARHGGRESFRLYRKIPSAPGPKEAR